jgi:phosphoribosylformylglycinamidine (FGAM) synthase PurS component
MSKTIENAVKRMKQEVRIAKAYAMPVMVKDMKKNDESVKKFFESMKK